MIGLNYDAFVQQMLILRFIASRRIQFLSHPQSRNKHLSISRETPTLLHTRNLFCSTQCRPIEPSEFPETHPQLQYQWQEGVENLEGYGIGGYHPTHIGDQHCDGRYHVVHKLGYGTYSTVWLAKDNLKARYVALKILVAAAFEHNSESKILRALGLGNPEHEGRAYVSSLLDEFVIKGPNGRHLCVVGEAAGCSVAQSKETSTTWKFPANVARAVSAQVLLGLGYIHSCGVVHGGKSK
jgi:serine/threonine-protein kinase SRPK3